MNNLNSSANFKASPIASPMAPNLNASLPMMGGRRRRRKTSKKGGMETPKKSNDSEFMGDDLIDTPENVKSTVTPWNKEKEYLFGKPKQLFESNEQDITGELVADDKDYDNMETVEVVINSDDNDNDNKMQTDDDELSKLEQGLKDETSGGSRRRKRGKNKTIKRNKKTKKNRKYKKTKKTRKVRKTHRK